jgi:methylenetetrahydrofolate dehydrogenase (NADP+) / methenyltetrahydrofolate cyclohydrolase / formyltetrahydrofolate synthetase
METTTTTTTTTIINGRKLAHSITTFLKSEINRKDIRAPCVAVVLVGDRNDSACYVRMKQKTAKSIGIDFKLLKCRSNVTHHQLEKVIKELNSDSNVDGIIVQLPLPDHLDAGLITSLVRFEKDVDGFHPKNTARLITNNEPPWYVACTARGVIRMIRHTGVELSGALVALIGTGMVGKPLALLLVREKATVLCCNKDTRNIATLTKQADIVVAAAGCPKIVKGDWIKPGAIVIDVGINSIDDPSRKSGKRLVGDVDFDEVSKVAGFISPVPGGVGPMTVAMLMTAVVEAWKRNNCLSFDTSSLPI